MSTCLLCKTEGVFRTKEHVIPESLGNDTEIIENVICEKCRNYFGREIEKPALEKLILQFGEHTLEYEQRKGSYLLLTLIHQQEE